MTHASALMARSAAVASLLTVAACIPTFETPKTTQQSISVQAFEEIATPFIHVWREPSHPFTGAAVIDVDGDGRMEVFVGGGRGQDDMLLAYRDGALVDTIKGRGLSSPTPATYGAASSDLDGDGDVDLAVVRDDGLTLYLNDGGSFLSRPVPITLAADAVPVSVAVADVDENGTPDLYLSVFVKFSAFRSATFNDPMHAKPNILLSNDGNLNFSDVTAASGTAGKQNTFHTTLADLDGDADLDMILSQNTGEVEILESNGDGTFTDRPTGTGFGFWMGLGVDDIDADGDLDIFVSNVGTSIPDFLTDGDLRDEQRHNTAWALLRNDGDFVFSDIAAEQGIDGYGFAWGAQFEDLNLDGQRDLLVAQNYIKWPLHKLRPLDGKAVLRLADVPEGVAYYQVDGLGLENPYFGQSPIIADLDADGRADVLWLNMDGPLTAFLNRSSGNFLSVEVPDTASAMGAAVTLLFADGTADRRYVVASTGLMTDPTPNVHFGFGDRRDVTAVEVRYRNGARHRMALDGINRTIPAPAP